MGITTGLTGSIIQAFSWMLIHSLWQGLLLALVATVLLALTKRASAAARYNLVLALFSVFLIAATGTFAYEYGNARRELAPSPLSYNLTHEINKVQAFSPSRVVFVSNLPKEGPSPFYSAKNINACLKAAGNYFSGHSFLIVMLWLIFFIAKSASMAGNMVYMHRARHYRVFEPGGYWKERVATLCGQLQLKKAVTLLESGYLKIPVVVGYLKPVILVPAGLLAGIPAAQVEAILLHELAHIRRNDYVVNFLQNVVEAVFFFNPGLLWVSARLKEERENCCDDMAIAQTNNKKAYIQALISFKEYSVSTPGYAVAFSGQKTPLLNRVSRIVYQENKTLSIKENGIFIAALLVLSLTAFTLYPAKDTKLAKPNSTAANLLTKHLKEVNINAPVYKNAAVPGVTAADATITAVGDNIDSMKVSAISDIEKTGPNFIAIIDDKEYPKDILYKISKYCLGGMAIYRPESGLQKYGPKASDGYIQIRTKHGEITYMGAIERENLIKEYSIPKSKFYNRIALKKEDGSFDKDEVVMNVWGGGSVKGSLPHDGKAGFYIDKTFYTEETIQKVSPATIASLTGEYGVEASNKNIEREQGYAIIFDFHTRETGASIAAPDTNKYAQLMGMGFGPNPLIFINGQEYPADIMTKINKSCINRIALYEPQQAVKKFGDKAKDGCLVLTVNGPIVYLTQAEQENRIAEAAVNKNDFLTRLVLRDKTGQLYDKIIIHDPAGNAVTTLEVSHNGKVGYYIDKDFYEEEDIKKLSPEMITSLSGEGGCRPPDLRIDKPGYESIFDFTTTKYYDAIKKDNIEFNTADIKVGKNAEVNAIVKLIPGVKTDAGGDLFYKGILITKLFLNNIPYTAGGIQQGMESLPADLIEKIKVKPSMADNGRAYMVNLITKGNSRLPAPDYKGVRYATWDNY